MLLALVAVLTAVSMPYFLEYLRSARIEGAAQQVAATLNQGRHLAIATNQSVCVEVTPTALRYRLASCAGTTWTGVGSDTSGHVRPPAGISLSATANPVFTYLGNASPGATYTISDSLSGRQLRVVVALSGRVRIVP
jgi:Tfp pilus assembly protein FimT